MKDQRAYFEKADFQSVLPYRLLIAIFGLFLVFLEVGLAQIPLFYGAAPYLSLIFIYYLRLHHPDVMPVETVFLIGMVADLLLSNILGGRATAMILLAYVIESRQLKLEQVEFAQLWVDFAVSCAAVISFQLIFFSLINLTLPTFGPFFFQIGVTLILFPIGFLMIYTAHGLLQTMKLLA